MVLLVLSPLVAKAEEQVPPAGYFTGIYARVGRDGATPPGLVNDFVQLAPDATGGVTVTPCEQGQGDLAFTLTFDRFGDVDNLLSTAEGADWLGCQFFNDMDNYPVLNCQDGLGGLVTFWPATEHGSCPAAD